ncbi:S9 family peptidase [Gillisia limnaea]|uniref:Peptidase S9B dipeptidylpeptidase IV domain protein n=1 Tax=Gillisia limnaea (strain DSM 15749 / LMG 21470 / R-8282) TaxID=865937 RepID=H2BZI4_GILLR|nr:S9 family peptidase [Gillisia limnaea]EHQ02347.1 peptidase S9B dipeptidylpeptidase IV domain protein [Gillisia limnaea DSM 15749]
MKLSKIIFSLFFVATTAVFAQQKEITLEEIWGGTFSQERLESLNSLNNGKEYIILNQDRDAGTSSIDVYGYESGEKTRTLVNSSNLEEISRFQGYELSDDESKILLGTQVEQIYRHSSRGIYFVYDIPSKTLKKLTDKKIQEPTFSPNGAKIAYVHDNNLYVKDLASGEEVQITSDGKKNEIINGITDWVYEEEFAFVRAFDWNANGNHIAYLKFDEVEVPEFSMDVFGADLYPGASTFKYPKAGEKNAEVSLHIYHLKEKNTTAVNLGDYEDFYIPRIEWTNNPEILSVQVLNRHQNNLDLHFVNSANNEVKLILNEKDKAYVDITDNLTFLEDNSFIWTSEKDGYNHIYHYDKSGKLINQITKGNWEVTNYYGFDPKSKTVFYQSTEDGSVNRTVYSIKANGKNKKRLTEKEGTNSADFSADFSYFINSFTNTQTPYVFTLHDAKNGKLIRKIKDNAELLEKEKAYGFSPKELSTIEVNGNELNMWMIRPSDFDPTKNYPLLMFQYSGPGSQTVSNTYFGTNDYWYQMLANEGYIIASVDGRGTGFKGAAFKKVTQNELGKYELEDQIAAAKKLGNLDYINKDRIGIWGWSYGGFMSTNAILKGNDVFSMAIAVAPVTSWRFYDTIYTERYMTTPQENPTGYDENSPINHVDKLKGDYLLVHGTADDNVHVQNTMRLIEALVQANKEFDWALYPDKNHGIYGGNTRLHLYTKMTNFIKENL